MRLPYQCAWCKSENEHVHTRTRRHTTKTPQKKREEGTHSRPKKKKTVGHYDQQNRLASIRGAFTPVVYIYTPTRTRVHVWIQSDTMMKIEKKHKCER